MMKKSNTDKGNKYHRKIYDIDGTKNVTVDIYRVADAYNCTSGEYHAIKKILMAGERGVKSKTKDLKEAVTALEAIVKCLEGQEKNESSKGVIEIIINEYNYNFYKNNLKDIKKERIDNIIANGWCEILFNHDFNINRGKNTNTYKETITNIITKYININPDFSNYEFLYDIFFNKDKKNYNVNFYAKKLKK